MGNMSFKSGNLAILKHKENDKRIFMFESWDDSGYIELFKEFSIIK